MSEYTTEGLIGKKIFADKVIDANTCLEEGYK